MSGLSPTSLSPSCPGWVYPRNCWASDQIPHHTGTSPLGPTQPLIQAAPGVIMGSVCWACSSSVCWGHECFSPSSDVSVSPSSATACRRRAEPNKTNETGGGGRPGTGLLSGGCRTLPLQAAHLHSGEAHRQEGPRACRLRQCWSSLGPLSRLQFQMDHPSWAAAGSVRIDHNPQDLLQTGCRVECTAPVTSCHPRSHELFSCPLLTAKHLNAPRLAQGHG